MTSEQRANPLLTPPAEHDPRVQAVLARAEQEARAFVETVSEEQLQIIRALTEALSNPDMAILVRVRLKPAAQYYLANDPAAVQTLVTWLHTLGFSSSAQKIVEPEETCYQVNLAKDTATLDQLEQTSAQKDHEAYGRLMGYPETAIQAFLKKERIKVSASTLDPENRMPVVLSPAHWPEELYDLAFKSRVIRDLKTRAQAE